MDSVTRDRIRSLLDEVRAVTPESGGCVEVTSCEDSVDIVGDELGFLRFGLALTDEALGSVADPRRPGDAPFLDVLTAGDGDSVSVRKVTSWEQLHPPPDRRDEFRDAVHLIACSLLVTGFAIIVLAGLFQIYSWVSGA